MSHGFFLRGNVNIFVIGGALELEGSKAVEEEFLL
jgi:hypothetical protein